MTCGLWLPRTPSAPAAPVHKSPAGRIGGDPWDSGGSDGGAGGFKCAGARSASGSADGSEVGGGGGNFITGLNLGCKQLNEMILLKLYFLYFFLAFGPLETACHKRTFGMLNILVLNYLPLCYIAECYIARVKMMCEIALKNCYSRGYY